MARRPMQYTTDREVQIALIEFAVYVCFLISATAVAFSVRNAHMFYFAKTIEKLFLKRALLYRHDTNFDKMVTTKQWWEFLENEFLDGLFGNSMYTEEQKLLQENLIMGPPRLRQIRVGNKTCEVHEAFTRYFKNCYAPYSVAVEDTSKTYKGSPFYALSDLHAYPHAGHVTTYEGGGFVKNLTLNPNQNRDIFRDLKNERWIDRGTRIVLIEFGLYNGNTEIFANVKFSAEVLPVGGIITQAYVHTFPLHTIWTRGDTLYLTAGVLFYGLIILFTVDNVRSCIKIGWKTYLLTIWPYLDLIILVSASLCLNYSYSHTSYVRTILETAMKSVEKYISLDEIANRNMSFLDCMGVLIFCVWVKVFKYMNFSSTLLQFTTTLNRCAKDLIGFGLMFLIVFLAYAMLGMLLFGTKHPSFRNFHEAFLTMMRMVLGDFDYVQLEEVSPVWGPLYFISYILFVFFILLNMFLAIIADTYTQVKREVNLDHNPVQRYLGKYCKCLRPKEKPIDPSESVESLSSISEESIRPANRMWGRQNVNGPSGSRPSRVGTDGAAVGHFEEIDMGDGQRATLLSQRLMLVEDLMEELVLNMDRLMRKVDGREGQGWKDPKDGKDAEDGKDAKDAKDGKEGKDAKDGKEGKDDGNDDEKDDGKDDEKDGKDDGKDK